MTNGPAVRVLGPVRLRTPDGGWAEPPGSLPTRLVVALALAGQDGRSVAALAEDVWPDREPRNPRAALQMLVSRTRAVAAEGAVESTAAGYRLGASDLGDAEHADGSAAAAALGLWRGEPAADLEPSSLADELAARAARARRRLLTLEGDRLLQERRPAEALPLLEELVAADPLDGAATRRLMAALRDCGATDRALAAFARHREALADALGTDPASETTALNTDLLRRADDGGDRSSAELVGVRASATPLLGRDEDVAQLLAAVPAHRLVSIVGTGGLGKTRLAHAVAAGMAGRFDRIVFTELAGAREADDVALVVGAAVGARPAQAPRRIGDPPPADLASRTREALAAARTLLVLDNCEQVVDAVARLTADLLAAVAGLTVLTTSRIPLLLAGEQVVALQPLPPAGAAAALFTARASSARPGVALDPGVVERVCQRLDGLPLAIELAAARLRSMSLAELDRRLEDRFAVLVGGDRTAPERHRTLFAVIDWSRRLLSPAARDALALLAVFPDGFTAASAADLLDGDATDVLLELVDQSLLAFRDDRGADGRYRMLETVREFGLRDLADTDRLPEARRALDRWALRLVRRLDEGLLLGRDAAASRAIADEEETLLAALRAAPAGREQVVIAVFGVLAEHWAYRGDFEAAIDALPLVVAAAGRRPTGPEERAESLRALSLAAAVSGAARSPAGTRAIALLRRALRSGPDDGGFWEVLGGSLLATGSAEGLADGVDRLSTHPDPAVRAVAMSIRAQLLENRGRAEEALALLRQVDALAVRHGFEWLRIFAGMSAVSLLNQRGRYATALDTALALRTDAVALDAGMNLQQLDWLIATDRLALGELDAAEALFEALRTATARAASGDGADTHAIATAGLAEVATARGDAGLALPRWARALEDVRRSSWPWRVVVLAASLGGRARLGAPVEELVRDHRRLRGLLLAVARMDAERLDTPIFGAGLLGVSVLLREEQPDVADRLRALALAVGARQDSAELHRLAQGPEPVLLDAGAALEQALALLRSPAARR